MILQSCLTDLSNPPDIWGEGAIFAFSGLDGPTNARSGFVATFGSTPYDLLIHTPRQRVVTLRPADWGTVRLATNDSLLVAIPAGDLAVTFAAWHTIIGQVPEGTTPTLTFIGAEPPPVVDGIQITVDPVNEDALALAVQNGRFAVAYGQAIELARQRASDGLSIDLAETMARRLAFLNRLSTGPAPERDRLLQKCLSVMKVNTLAPEGVHQRFWSTPDRAPHRQMWLWDSVFHSLAMNYLDPEVAWHFLAAVLDRQRDSGLIPHIMTPDGRYSDITQPPLLAWGVWENYRRSGNEEALRYALPRLARYLTWNLKHRDRNENGLLEWFIEADPQSRSGESGMDNSPRFDRAQIVDAVDFSTFQAQDMLHLSRIARELGKEEMAVAWAQKGTAMAHQIHTQLWDVGGGFYFDRDMTGQLTGVKAVSGLLPLLLDDIPAEHVTCLESHLLDQRCFNAPFPLPSVALDDPNWSTDMWRGATWINMNYLVVTGLLKHNRRQAARAIVERTLHHVEKYYRQYGVIFEFYDAKDQVPPVDCDRKGKRQKPYDIRVKMDSIRDYHWSAALAAAWLLDGPFS